MGVNGRCAYAYLARTLQGILSQKHVWGIQGRLEDFSRGAQQQQAQEIQGHFSIPQPLTQGNTEAMGDFRAPRSWQGQA